MRRRTAHFSLAALLWFGCASDPAAEDAGPVLTDAEVDAARAIEDSTAPAGDAGGPGTDASRPVDGGDGTDGAAGGDGGGPPLDAGLAPCSDGVDNDGDGRIDEADRGCDGPNDDNEGDEIALPECSDGADNDADGLFDLEDPDCTSEADPRESGANAPVACSNGADDDEDGLYDFPDDPGCRSAGDDDEADPERPAACANLFDDDEDALVDYPADPGCAGRGDSSERDDVVAPACANGVDDDGDGATDYPDDPGCIAAGDHSEVGACGEGVEVVDLNAHLDANEHFDGNTAEAPAGFVGTCGGAAGGEQVFTYRVDRPLERVVFSTQSPETTRPTVVYVRRQCLSAGDIVCNRGSAQSPGTSVTVERPADGVYYVIVDTSSREAGGGPFRLTVDAVITPACRDALDNDEDGQVDNADVGCVDRDDPDETDPPEPPVCSDGLDNDDDGHPDHPDDPDCEFAGGPREEPVCPGGAPTVAVGQAGGAFELPVTQGQGASQPSCEQQLGSEAVLILTLDLPSDVTVDVREGANPAIAAVYVRTDCHEAGSEIACRTSNARDLLQLEALARGTYFIVIEQGFVPPPMARFAHVTVESVVTECNDEVDNDNDGRIDLADPGCERGRDPSEVDPPVPPACADGIDNDDDGVIDYPDEPGCDAAGDDDEADWRPPAVGQAGREGVLNGDPWVVCRADERTAWLAANTGGQYNAVVACQSVGYARVDAWGGTCGTVCGYCNQPGDENYDNGGGGDPSSIGNTVHWRCVRE